MDGAMTREEVLVKLLAPLRSDPARAAILCDVDGTLAPIVPDPAAAKVPDSTRTLLHTLASAYGLVGCVTGRRASLARAIVGLPELHYAGNHGLELLLPGDDEPRPDPALGRRATAALALVSRLDPSMLADVGLRVEDKGPIQALHWRGAPDEAMAAQRAREIAELVESEGLTPHFGRKVLEVRPIADINKGTAVRALLAQRDGLRLAAFGGDDATDLDAFGALRALTSEGRLDAVACIGVDSGEAPERLVELSDALVDGTGGFQAALRLLAEPVA